MVDILLNIVLILAVVIGVAFEIAVLCLIGLGIKALWNIIRFED